jgi:hypothetical protein
VCNCLIDEGRPLGTGWQEQVPNHLRRLWSKALVVSTEGKGLERTRSGDGQEEDRKGTTDDMSKAKERCRNRGGVVNAGRASAGPVYGPKRHPALRWPELVRGGRAERGNLGLRCERRSRKWKNHEGESTEAEPRGGTTRSSREVPETGWSEGVVLWS